MAAFLTHPIPAVIILLGLLILIHELGHFVVGRFFGIGVEVFSIGFGQKIFSFNRNGTDYRISWLPLGGYVKFAGASRTEPVPPHFVGKEMFRTSPAVRAAVLFAGPFANLLLAAITYAVLGWGGIEHAPSIIGSVRPGSPAELAGLESGDEVTQIGDVEVKKWPDLQKLISASPGKAVAIQVMRDNVSTTFQVTPDTVSSEDFLGRQIAHGQIGVGFGFPPSIVTVIPGSAIAQVGIATGDRILSVSAGDKMLATKTWPELLNALVIASGIKPSELRLAVHKPDQAEAAPPQMIILHTDWTALQSSAQGRVLGKELAQRMGLLDSQLTIAKAETPSDAVLQKGDRILALGSQPMNDIFALYQALERNRDSTIELTVQRGALQVKHAVPLKPVEVQKAKGKETVYMLNVGFYGASEAPAPYVERYTNPISAMAFGIRTTGVQIAALGEGIWGLITGSVPLQTLGGPLLIAKVAGDSAKQGLQSFLMSLALISINLGIVNLFPIPVLDGGQLVLVGVEVLRRRPLSEIAIENYQKIGFVLILGLVVMATYNDLSRFWSSMLQGMTGWFK